MKNRALTLARCAVLALGLLAGSPAALASAGGAAGGGVFQHPVSLEFEMDTSEYAEDFAALPEPGEGEEVTDPLGVVVDLYLVQYARKWTGYDAYFFDSGHLEPGFAGIEGFPEDIDAMRELTNEAWDELSAAAAKLALSPGQGDVPAQRLLDPEHENIGLGEKLEDLPAGLYLAVPHGRGMEPADYIVSAEGDDGETYVGAIANTADYEYTFRPQLVALPIQAAGDSGLFNGRWEDDITQGLKADRRDRYGKLRITKNIDVYDVDEPATFVFQVKAEKNGETVYSNVVGLTFSRGAVESAELDRIPVRSTVTVTEIYSGSAYTISGAGEQSGEITVENVLELTFTNTHDREQKRGHGIINEFVYDGESWELAQVGPEQAET